MEGLIENLEIIAMLAVMLFTWLFKAVLSLVGLAVIVLIVWFVLSWLRPVIVVHKEK